MTDAAPAESDGPRDLRKELHTALRACTPKQRKWLHETDKLAGRKWAACKKLGLSNGTVWKWVRQERIAKVLELQALMAEQDHDITRQRILQQYERLAFSDIRQLYDASGAIKNPHEWDDETAAAVIEHGFDSNGMPKVKLNEKRAALDALARIQGVLIDKHVLTGPNGEPLAVSAPVIHIVERPDPD